MGKIYGHMLFRELLTAVDSWEDGTARIWTVETGECAAKLEGHTGPAPWRKWSKVQSVMKSKYLIEIAIVSSKGRNMSKEFKTSGPVLRKERNMFKLHIDSDTDTTFLSLA